MTPDRECPGDDCRQRFHSDRALERHFERFHADHGRWVDSRQLVADGGTAEMPTFNEAVERGIREYRRCYYDPEASAEAAALHLLSEARKQHGGEP